MERSQTSLLVRHFVREVLQGGKEELPECRQTVTVDGVKLVRDAIKEFGSEVDENLISWAAAFLREFDSTIHQKAVDMVTAYLKRHRLVEVEKRTRTTTGGGNGHDGRKGKEKATTGETIGEATGETWGVYVPDISSSTYVEQQQQPDHRQQQTTSAEQDLTPTSQQQQGQQQQQSASAEGNLDDGVDQQQQFESTDENLDDNFEGAGGDSFDDPGNDQYPHNDTTGMDIDQASTEGESLPAAATKRTAPDEGGRKKKPRTERQQGANDGIGTRKSERINKKAVAAKTTTTTQTSPVEVRVGGRGRGGGRSGGRGGGRRPSKPYYTKKEIDDNAKKMETRLMKEIGAVRKEMREEIGAVRKEIGALRVLIERIEARLPSPTPSPQQQLQQQPLQSSSPSPSL